MRSPTTLAAGHVAFSSGNKSRMSDLELSDAERALRDFRQKLAKMPCDPMGLSAVECEVRALTEALGRELMAAALKRADTDAPEVMIDG